MPQHYTSFEDCMQQRTQGGMNRRAAQRACSLHFARKAGIAHAFGQPIDRLSNRDLLLVAIGLKDQFAQSEQFERCVEQNKARGMNKEEAIAACQRAFERAQNG